MNRPPFALLSVVALLAAGVGLARAGDPEPARQAAVRHETRPVDGALAVCPELLKEGTDVVTRLTAGVAAAGDVTVRAATLTTGQGLGRAVLKQGADVGALNLTANTSVAAVVTATGPQAGGLEVEQVSRGADGPNRGWAGTRCEPPAADSWFLGGATTVGNDTQLVLVNPYDDQALVRVELYGGKGLIDIPDLDGIVLPPRGRVTRELAKMAPDEGQLAIHVVAREGRVAPAVRVHRAHGTTPFGVDWLPRLSEPKAQVDVPGIPAGAVGQRRLYLFAPGDTVAHVQVQLTFPDEQIVPIEFSDVDVAPGRPLGLNLTELLTVVNQRTGEKTMRPVGVRVYAEGAPVLVTALAESQARFTEIREFAFVGPAEPLTGPTLVTEGQVAEDMDCELLFHAPDGPARVVVTTLLSKNEKGTPVRKSITLEQGELMVFKYRSLPKDRLSSVVITPVPGMAPVYASRMVFEYGGRGPLFTVQSLVTQPTAGFDVPAVTSDPSAALPNARRD